MIGIEDSLRGSYIYADESVRIRVTASVYDGKADIRFDVLDHVGIIPAMHWMEWIRPENRRSVGNISVRQVRSLDGEIAANYADLDHKTVWKAAHDYNFALLRDDLAHPMSEVLAEFKGFLLQKGDDATLGLLVKDIPASDMSQLMAALKDKVSADPGTAVYLSHRLDRNSVPSAAYVHFSDDISPGLKKRIGKSGHYRGTALGQRILIA